MIEEKKPSPDWFFQELRVHRPATPPKALSPEDREFLRRRNLSCRAKGEHDRIMSTLRYIGEEERKLEEGRTLLVKVEEFLHYYERAMSGEYDEDYPDQPWFSLMEMTLDLLKTTAKEKEDRPRERFEAAVLSAFIERAKLLGFEYPTGQSRGTLSGAGKADVLHVEASN